MPRTWEKLANADSLYNNESDYQAAAYQLVTAQVLYEQDQTQRVSYHLVRRYPTEFKEALALFGMELIISDDYRYCAAVPRESRKVLLPLQETLLILVMRQLFHERAMKGELDSGRAVVTIEELQTHYTQATNRVLPQTATDLRETLAPLRRYGLTRLIDTDPGDAQPFSIAIQPAIEELVNEAAVSKLGAYQAARASATAESRQGEDDHEAA
jgi:hypothetical protein